MDLVFLCDFDGTITTIDTVNLLLERFAKEDWKLLHTQLERGEITLRECMLRQYSMLSVSKQLMLRELEKSISFRANFEKLVYYSRRNNIPFYIVSAGLDFIIKHFLELKKLDSLIDVFAAKTSLNDKGIKLTFPELFDEESVDFKEDLVKHFTKSGGRVIYIGDGLADYYAVRRAYFSFPIRDSKLAQLCKNQEIPHMEIDDFQEVIDTVDSIINK